MNLSSFPERHQDASSVTQPRRAARRAEALLEVGLLEAGGRVLELHRGLEDGLRQGRRSSRRSDDAPLQRNGHDLFWNNG